MDKKISVSNKEIGLYTYDEKDYVCLTDIAKYKDPVRSDYIIQNWLRNRNTIEFLGIWERINNPNFNPSNSMGLKKQAGIHSFTLTAKQWTEKTNALRVISKTYGQQR